MPYTDDVKSKISETYESYLQAEENRREEEMLADAKKRTRLLVIIITAIVAALAVAIIVGVSYFNRPQAKIAKAFGYLAKDMSSYQDEMISPKDLEKYINMVSYGNVDLTYSLNVDGVDGLPTTIGVDGELIRRYDDKLLKSNNSVSAMNINLLDLNLYADGTTIVANVPQISDSNFIFDGQTFAQDFNSSILGTLSGTQLPSDLVIDPFANEKNKDIKIVDSNKLIEKYEDDFKTLYKGIKVSKTGSEVSVTLNDAGKNVISCKEYEIEIQKEALEPLLKKLASDSELGLSDYVDANDCELGDNVRLNVSLDSDGYIRCIESAQSIVLGQASLYFMVYFTGDERETDMIDITSNYDADNLTYGVKAWIGRDSSGNFDVIADVVGSENVSFTARGNMNYDENAEELTCVLERLQIDLSGDELFHTNGTVKIKNADSERINIPNDNIVDIMNMDLMDIIGLAGDLGSNSENLKNLWEMFG